MENSDDLENFEKLRKNLIEQFDEAEKEKDLEIKGLILNELNQIMSEMEQINQFMKDFQQELFIKKMKYRFEKLEKDILKQAVTQKFIRDAKEIQKIIDMLKRDFVLDQYEVLLQKLERLQIHFQRNQELLVQFKDQLPQFEQKIKYIEEENSDQIPPKKQKPKQNQLSFQNSIEENSSQEKEEEQQELLQEFQNLREKYKVVQYNSLEIEKEKTELLMEQAKRTQKLKQIQLLLNEETFKQSEQIDVIVEGQENVAQKIELGQQELKEAYKCKFKERSKKIFLFFGKIGAVLGFVKGGSTGMAVGGVIGGIGGASIGKALQDEKNTK